MWGLVFFSQNAYDTLCKSCFKVKSVFSVSKYKQLRMGQFKVRPYIYIKNKEKSINFTFKKCLINFIKITQKESMNLKLSQCYSFLNLNKNSLFTQKISSLQGLRDITTNIPSPRVWQEFHENTAIKTENLKLTHS